MRDKDVSYDVSEIVGFVNPLRAGNALVVGSRLRDEIKEGAMLSLHRRLGNPILIRIANYSSKFVSATAILASERSKGKPLSRLTSRPLAWNTPAT